MKNVFFANLYFGAYLVYHSFEHKSYIDYVRGICQNSSCKVIYHVLDSLYLNINRILYTGTKLHMLCTFTVW